MVHKRLWLLAIVINALVLALLVAGCSTDTALEDTVATDTTSEQGESGSDAEMDGVEDDHIEEEGEHEVGDEHANEADDEMIKLPEIEALELNGEPLRVIATTSIIGDVVAQVGGDAIELTTLIGIGQDSHSFETSPRDLASVTKADVIFINGWDLEEGLVHDLEEIAEEVPIVAISANIAPLAPGEDEHEHEPGHHGHDDPVDPWRERQEEGSGDGHDGVDAVVVAEELALRQDAVDYGEH